MGLNRTVLFSQTTGRETVPHGARSYRAAFWCSKPLFALGFGLCFFFLPHSRLNAASPLRFPHDRFLLSSAGIQQRLALEGRLNPEAPGFAQRLQHAVGSDAGQRAAAPTIPPVGQASCLPVPGVSDSERGQTPRQSSNPDVSTGRFNTGRGMGTRAVLIANLEGRIIPGSGSDWGRTFPCLDCINF